MLALPCIVTTCSSQAEQLLPYYRTSYPNKGISFLWDLMWFYLFGCSTALDTLGSQAYVPIIGFDRRHHRILFDVSWRILHAPFEACQPRPDGGGLGSGGSGGDGTMNKTAPGHVSSRRSRVVAAILLDGHNLEFYRWPAGDVNELLERVHKTINMVAEGWSHA
ncbi:hypothetical protein VOLCADRAFT_92415 [Volvox carteri f. nagariensis]|uniref:Uncharacterized protein n=1 Tax=Volvox carteri f. nagariensis TaxID=3068 RepID=D8TZL6_VOLCA|nr:uncharacterized protein VOLCADRAFT_92415 [Volvox carteri f. nagariensis]EFJ46948.1 hypothetical protein VOLCADRAFT_92415 [Volvox carteri f. nagariensis]|eukprot:XP_002951843.1 hypothetical protein VOLCADRAFT_92415 [Volvox carteri f. nagariensis]